MIINKKILSLLFVFIALVGCEKENKNPFGELPTALNGTAWVYVYAWNVGSPEGWYALYFGSSTRYARCHEYYTTVSTPVVDKDGNPIPSTGGGDSVIVTTKAVSDTVSVGSYLYVRDEMKVFIEPEEPVEPGMTGYFETDKARGAFLSIGGLNYQRVQ
ncbi:MAG: hypothetical protein PUB21_06040 [Bacteroidales bacterium]|nr:hypothetical protein [Bacteroidales bacterium]